jgi:hypothetical protein
MVATQIGRYVKSNGLAQHKFKDLLSNFEWKIDFETFSAETFLAHFFPLLSANNGLNDVLLMRRRLQMETNQLHLGETPIYAKQAADVPFFLP